MWADRLNRRNVMVASDLGRAAAQATLATLLLTDAAQLWHVVALAVVYGFTRWDTSLGREIPLHVLSRVTSLDWFTTTGLMPIGFAVVAPAAELIGTQTTMLTCAVTVIALFAAALAVGDVRRLTAP